jgi:hypothetical protein
LTSLLEVTGQLTQCGLRPCSPENNAIIDEIKELYRQGEEALGAEDYLHALCLAEIAEGKIMDLRLSA